MDKNSDLPAFPVHPNVASHGCGLTKREYLAAVSFAALLSARPQYLQNQQLPQCAAAAIAGADALLDELEKPKP